MKPRYKISALTFVAIAVTIFFSAKFIKPELLNTENKSQEDEKSEQMSIKSYADWMSQMLKNPSTGTLTFNDIYNGRKQVEAYQNKSTRGGSILSLNWETMGPNNIGGRTRAILFDRNNNNIMYAGGVSGGVYISTDAGLSWNPSSGNYMLGSVLVSSLAQDADGSIYVGTGEYFPLNFFDGSFSATPAFTGDGMYKSTDGGTTFTLLSATQPTPGIIGTTTLPDWSYVNRIATHPTNPGVVVAAIQGGLMYSIDGGVNWSFCTSSSSNMSLTRATDVVFDSEGYIHAIYGNKYYRSSITDAPFELAQMGENLPSSTSISRAVIAVAPSDANSVYFYAANTASDLEGVYRSTDRGQTFTKITPPASDLFNPPSGQGYYNLCIAVNPLNPERIYIGGATQSYSWTASTGTWTLMTSQSSFSLEKYMHPDHHVIAFRPDNPEIMFFGHDGGISRTLDASELYPDFGILNKGYNVTQMNGVAVGIYGEVLGGSQDNGTSYVDFLGNSPLEARLVLGGDGGKTEISKIRPEYLFGAFASFDGGNFVGGFLNRSVNNGNSFASIYDCNVDKLGGTGTGECKPNGAPDNGSEFVMEYKMWENYALYATFKNVLNGIDSVEYPVGSGTFYHLNDVVNYEGRDVVLNRTGLSESKLYIASGNNVWLTTGALFNSTDAPVWFKVASGLTGTVSSLEFSNDGDKLFIGTRGGKLYKLSGLATTDFKYDYADTDGDGTLDQLPWIPADEGITQFNYTNVFSGSITGISMDRNNPDHVVLSLSGYGVDNNVFNCNNALSDSTAVFTSISSELPDIPVFDVLVHVYNPDIILAATEFGVWSYNLSTGGEWTQENSIIGNVPVMEIREDWVRTTDCYAIYIGTHGQGFYRATNVASAACDFSLQNDIATDAGPIQEEIIAGISLNPNPADVSTVANITLNSTAIVTTKLYSMSGIMLKNFGTANYNSGTYHYTLDVHDIAPGTYLVVFEVNGTLTSRKLSII